MNYYASGGAIRKLGSKLRGGLETLRGFWAEPKKEIVPYQASDDLMREASSGNPLAVEALAKSVGAPTPTTTEELQALIRQVMNPDMSRRQLMGNMLGQTAQLMVPKSPLTLLNETAQQLKPNLTLTLSPMEMMQYSQKYLDRPVDFGLSRTGDFIPTGVNKPLFETFSNISRVNTGDYDQTLDSVLKSMELEPTPVNRDSLVNLVEEAADPFHPGQLSMNREMMDDLVFGYVDRDYELNDDIIDRLAREWGSDFQTVHSTLADFASRVHGSSKKDINSPYYERMRQDDDIIDSASPIVNKMAHPDYDEFEDWSQVFAYDMEELYKQEITFSDWIRKWRRSRDWLLDQQFFGPKQVEQVESVLSKYIDIKTGELKKKKINRDSFEKQLRKIIDGGSRDLFPDDMLGPLQGEPLEGDLDPDARGRLQGYDDYDDYDD